MIGMLEFHTRKSWHVLVRVFNWINRNNIIKIMDIIVQFINAKERNTVQFKYALNINNFSQCL